MLRSPHPPIGTLPAHWFIPGSPLCSLSAFSRDSRHSPDYLNHYLMSPTHPDHQDHLRSVPGSLNELDGQSYAVCAFFAFISATERNYALIQSFPPGFSPRAALDRAELPNPPTHCDPGNSLLPLHTRLHPSTQNVSAWWRHPSVCTPLVCRGTDIVPSPSRSASATISRIGHNLGLSLTPFDFFLLFSSIPT